MRKFIFILFLLSTLSTLKSQTATFLGCVESGNDYQASFDLYGIPDTVDLVDLTITNGMTALVSDTIQSPLSTVHYQLNITLDGLEYYSALAHTYQASINHTYFFYFEDFECPSGPTPADDSLTTNFKVITSGARIMVLGFDNIFDMKIYSTNGREIFFDQISASTTELSAGVYIIVNEFTGEVKKVFVGK